MHTSKRRSLTALLHAGLTLGVLAFTPATATHAGSTPKCDGKTATIIGIPGSRSTAPMATM